MFIINPGMSEVCMDNSSTNKNKKKTPFRFNEESCGETPDHGKDVEPEELPLDEPVLKKRVKAKSGKNKKAVIEDKTDTKSRENKIISETNLLNSDENKKQKKTRKSKYSDSKKKLYETVEIVEADFDPNKTFAGKDCPEPEPEPEPVQTLMTQEAGAILTEKIQDKPVEKAQDVIKEIPRHRLETASKSAIEHKSKVKALKQAKADVDENPDRELSAEQKKITPVKDVEKNNLHPAITQTKERVNDKLPETPEPYSKEPLDDVNSKLNQYQKYPYRDENAWKKQLVAFLVIMIVLGAAVAAVVSVSLQNNIFSPGGRNNSGTAIDQDPSGQTVNCSVCNKTVHRTQAEFTHETRSGNVLYFDTEECYKKFLREPARYLNRQNNSDIKVDIRIEEQPPASDPEPAPQNPDIFDMLIEDVPINVPKNPGDLDRQVPVPPRKIEEDLFIEDIPLNIPPAPERVPEPPVSQPHEPPAPQNIDRDHLNIEIEDIPLQVPRDGRTF
jgi:YHS domain-containing protein